MASRSIAIRHRFDGGWSTDHGPLSDVAPGRDGALGLPWLNEADNVIYDLDGGPHKAPGTAKINGTALESGAAVKGLFDAWFSDGSQHRIAHVGTKIKRDNADGSFTDLFTGLQSGKVPSYSMLNDILVMASNSTADVPKSWDGTTAQNLAGTPPNFSMSRSHKNRMWAAGNASASSRLYYSVLLDPEDWAGSGSGNIDIEPEDGDEITGIFSYKNELWVFKGPHKGSIHRITGSAPTGDDAFARTTFISGLGAAANNTIFTFGSDLGFMWSDGTVRSLEATASFGDFEEASLSRQINTWLRDHVNFSLLAHSWSADWPEYGVVLFGLAIDSSTVNNMILGMDYRFKPPRWFKWSSFSGASSALAIMVDAADNDRRRIMSGGDDGFVRKFGMSTRSIDGDTAISYAVHTPYLTYSSALANKTLMSGSLAISPKNNGDMTFSWQRDGKAAQSQTVNQGGTDVLGPADADEFTLGTSTLGGSEFVDRFFDLPEGGEFRAVQYKVENGVNNEDVELHAIGAIISRGAWSLEND